MTKRIKERQAKQEQLLGELLYQEWRKHKTHLMIKALDETIEAHKQGHPNPGKEPLKALQKEADQFELGRLEAARMREAIKDADHTLGDIMAAIGSEPVDPITVLHLLYSGEEVKRLREAEKPDVDRGRKIKRAAELGHETVHGTKNEKQKEYAELREAYRIARKTYKPKKVAKSIVSERFCVSIRKIERAFKAVDEKIP